MAMSKEPSTEERAARASRVPESRQEQTRRLVNVLAHAARVVDSRSKRSERNKTVVFEKKKPAISSVTHGRVHDPDGCDECNRGPSKRNGRTLTQDFLEAGLACQREFREFEETLAFGISHGFVVEPGARTIEFVPVHCEDGGTHLKLEIR
jgi:hypothetical protein